MSLLISQARLRDRQPLAAGALHPLAQSLAEDLRVVIDRPLHVPDQKALLSREGGRCSRDGTMLDFDPFSPHEHRCPTCGVVYRGELHDRFWIYWYQLWLAERAVHGALLSRLGIEPRGAGLATSILDAYADRYLKYPNVDNALGPTRPFFSTYLESIWLLQLCVAVDLLGGQADGVADRVRDRIIEPSSRLIASFDEGMSNRQVWNNAAMMAAARILGRPDDFDSIVWAESGLAAHLGDALLPDGTWYEGENYHLFAHRGLWYGVVMAELADAELPRLLVDRFDAAFATPFLTALPDFTLPSRRDSQYAISLRQWRFAELCELGLARSPNRILGGALSRMYADDLPRRETGRSSSSADVERNLPATRLTRADLNWKSLLFARASVDAAPATTPPSALLESQGIAVFRRDAGKAYVALDYGHSGGGHGHPDRLNLLLMDGETRWLDDYGTGSYVDPSLHWYRSTLAHNAPMLGLRTQRSVNGVLQAYEDRGAAGWILADAGIDGMAGASRQLVVMPNYVVDTITWRAAAGDSFALPLHVDGHAEAETAVVLNDQPMGRDAGFRFVHDAVRIASTTPDEPLKLSARRDGKTLDLWVASDSPLEIIRMMGPAAPGAGEAPFLLVRSPFASGALRTLWSWRGSVKSVAFGSTTVVEVDDERHEISASATTCSVVMHAGVAQSSIDFTRPSTRPGMVEEIEDVESYHVDRDVDGDVIAGPLEIMLGEEAYVRSEQSWNEAGRPAALVRFGASPDALRVEVEVENVDPTFVAPGAINRLDNESADINGAGVQLYLRSGGRTAGFVLVPIAGADQVNVRPIDGWGNDISVDATWASHPSGYRIDIGVASLDGEVEVDLVVNEKPEGRERRRGQLVLSGGGGFVYLRGDRHDPNRLISIQLPDA